MTQHPTHIATGQTRGDGENEPQPTRITALLEDAAAIDTCRAAVSDARLEVESGLTFSREGQSAAIEKALHALADTLGRPLLVLDQFEEVLGDPRLAKPSLDLLESVYAEHTAIRQIVAMRSERAEEQLLPLAQGRIDNWLHRTTRLEPLPASVFRQIVKEVCETFAATHPGLAEWRIDDGALSQLLDCIGDRASLALIANAALYYLYDRTADSGIATIGDVTDLVRDSGDNLDGILRLWIRDRLEGRVPLHEMIPVPGPRPYDAGLERYFRGRESELRSLQGRVDAQRFSVLLAPSGSGKTSLLNAGLIPRLRRRRVESLIAPVADRQPSLIPIAVSRWDHRAEKDLGSSFAWVFIKGIEASLDAAHLWYGQEILAVTDGRLLPNLKADDAKTAAKAIAAAIQESERGAASRSSHAITIDGTEIDEFSVVPASKTMAAKMSARLVSYSNYKRPVDQEELADEAYLIDIGKSNRLASVDASWIVGAGPLRRDPSGNVSDTADGGRLGHALEAVFGRTLDVLRDGAVLKPSGVTYELVHDGFCIPFVEWSREWLESPEARFGALSSSAGAVISFGTANVRERLQDASDPVVRGVVWRNSLINASDFRDLRFVDCDFAGSRFEECQFASPDEAPVFEGCVFKGADFNRCVFSGAHVGAESRPRVQIARDCDFARTNWSGCTLDRVRFEYSDQAGGMPQAQFVDKSTLTACEFLGGDLGNLQFNNGSVIDGIAFTGSKLTGSGLEDLCVEGTTDWSFTDCAMNAVRLENIDFGRARLSIIGTASDGRSMLSGCYFKGITLRERPQQSRHLLHNTRLGGGMFDGCSINSTDISGDGEPVLADSLLILFGALNDVRFAKMRCNGLSMVGVRLEGPCVFDECEMLRPSFEGLEFSGETGRIDLKASPHLLYARAWDETIAGRIDMTPAQRLHNPLVDRAAEERKLLDRH